MHFEGLFRVSRAKKNGKILCHLFNSSLLQPLRVFIRMSQHFDSVQFHLREDTYTRLVLYDININKIIRIKTRAPANPRAEFSSERAGLAGWYCRAGCGRSSHFGDEISLSNPAPCFIYPSRLSAFYAMAVISSLRLTSWPTTNTFVERFTAGSSSPQEDNNPRFFYPNETHFCIFVCQKLYTILIFI